MQFFFSLLHQVTFSNVTFYSILHYYINCLPKNHNIVSAGKEYAFCNNFQQFKYQI